MRTKNRKILITGAKGFIGSKCLNILKTQEEYIHATSSKPINNEKNVTWHQINLLDPSACKTLIEQIKPTHLIHLAWTARPGKFWTDVENFSWLKAGIELFKNFYINGGERAIGIGSCAEYQPNHHECKETVTPTLPNTIYGYCKLSLALTAQAYSTHFKKSLVWGRLFCPYGPKEHYGRFIPTIIDNLLLKKNTDCTEGKQIRDFIYIEDVANVIIKLLNSNIQGPVNIASGNPISLKEIANIITSNIKNSNLINFGKLTPPANDPQRLVANVDRIKQELEYELIYDLDKGIKAVIDYRKTILSK